MELVQSSFASLTDVCFCLPPKNQDCDRGLATPVPSENFYLIYQVRRDRLRLSRRDFGRLLKRQCIRGFSRFVSQLAQLLIWQIKVDNVLAPPEVLHVLGQIFGVVAGFYRWVMVFLKNPNIACFCKGTLRFPVSNQRKSVSLRSTLRLKQDLC